MNRNKLYLSILCILLVFILSYKQKNIKASPKDWPSFTMVYKQSNLGIAESDILSEQIVQFDYTNTQKWRVEILSHSSLSEIVGSWAEYDGTSIKNFDSREGIITTSLLEDSQGIYIPEEWLRPSFIADITNKGGTVKNVDQDKSIITYKEFIPCNDFTKNIDQKRGLNPCYTGSRDTKKLVEYTNTDKIPTHIIDSVDGVVMSEVTVTKLVIK